MVFRGGASQEETLSVCPSVCQLNPNSKFCVNPSIFEIAFTHNYSPTLLSLGTQHHDYNDLYDTKNGRRPHIKWKTTSLKMEDDITQN